MNSGMIIGSQEELLKLIKEHLAVYVLFCRTNCPTRCSCDIAKETWKNLGEKHKSKSIAFMAVDCTNEEISKFESFCPIKAYLTVHLFKGDMIPISSRSLRDLNGSQDLKATVAAIESEIADMKQLRQPTTKEAAL